MPVLRSLGGSLHEAACHCCLEGERLDHQIRRLASLPRRPGRRVTAAEVERLAALLGLPLEPGSAAAVAEQLAGLLTYARLFAEFPLPDDVEPLPVSRP